MRFFQYLKYCFTSSYRHGYGIHSPYVYHLVTTIIEEHLPYYKYSLIEKVRGRMANIDGKKNVVVRGGSRRLETMKDIVSKYAINAKYGQLVFRLVNHRQPESIIEYGTTCGISTMYLAAPNSKTPVYSVTRQPELAELNRKLCDRIDMANIQRVVTQHRLKACEELIEKTPVNDFLFICEAKPEDVQALVKKRLDVHPEKFFIVVPSPYESKEAWSVWQNLLADSRVKVSINVFNYAILIGSPDFQKENYILRY